MCSCSKGAGAMGRAHSSAVACFVRRFVEKQGQATVEAAFLLPVLFGCILLLVQPGIVLYDLVVMRSAATEGCRLLSTSSAADAHLCDDYIRRRLGAVPPHECFHVHEGGCTWKIELLGDETTETVSVSISTALRPLPLIDFAGRAFGFSDENGNLRVEASATMPTQPSWALREAGGAPEMWPGAWAQDAFDG